MFGLSSDAAFLSTVFGCGLVYYELCSPGRIFPASLGALLAGAGLWSLFLLHPISWCIGLLAVAPVFFAAGTFWRTSIVLCAIGVVCTVLGFVFVIPGAARIHVWISLPASMVFAIGTALLLRIAAAGRRRKLNVDR